MKIKTTLTVIILAMGLSVTAQNIKQPVLIILKNGESIDAIHFGQLKCGKEIYSNNYIIIRGKYMDAVTEIKEFSEIEKIVPEGYTEAPVASVGNEHGSLRIIKKNGTSVTLEDAELVMSCYGPGDKYNELIVQILNPLTNQSAEQSIEVRNIQSIIFK